MKEGAGFLWLTQFVSSFLLPPFPDLAFGRFFYDHFQRCGDSRKFLNFNVPYAP